MRAVADPPSRQYGQADRGGRRRRAQAVAVAIVATAAVFLTGCGRMASALDQQWIVVNFAPNTTLATVMHVRAACSHIQNTPPMALPAKRSVLDVMYGVRFDTTNASPAQVTRLTECLQKFNSVQGLNPEDVGDEGS